MDFYTRLLGFELAHWQVQRNEYTSRLVGYPDAHLRVAQLAVPGQPRGLPGHDLELVQYISPAGQRGDNNICNPGQGHLALAVGDIHDRYAGLSRAGIEFFSPPNAITAGVDAGATRCTSTGLTVWCTNWCSRRPPAEGCYNNVNCNQSACP